MIRRAILLSAAALLSAQETSEPSLALNLPTALGLSNWDFAARFTHRFSMEARSGSRELYGLDGLAYAGFGFDLSLKPVRGLNLQIYRTADAKTLTFALHQRVWSNDTFAVAARAERFDETIKARTVLGVSEGIIGTSVQVPMEVRLGTLTVRAVPTWLSRTRTERSGLIALAGGLQWDLAAEHALLAEVYPKPASLDAPARGGWAAGYQWRTRGHRFTLMGTNVQGTTAHQVAGGDYAGGPRAGKDWALGFNLARIF